jgi:hypothetical protein
MTYGYESMGQPSTHAPITDGSSIWRTGQAQNPCNGVLSATMRPEPADAGESWREVSILWGDFRLALTNPLRPLAVLLVGESIYSQGQERISRVLTTYLL